MQTPTETDELRSRRLNEATVRTALTGTIHFARAPRETSDEERQRVRDNIRARHAARGSNDE